MKAKKQYKTPKSYRVYTGVRKIGIDYYEADYEEYLDDELYCTGTEDFTEARLRSATRFYYVHIYNGRINKGGGRMTTHKYNLRVSKNANAAAIARAKFENFAYLR